MATGRVVTRLARVLHVEEQRCEVWTGAEVTQVGFAPTIPGPRVERVSPGHLVALASLPVRFEVVVWRWYDAVVLGAADDGSVELWEPAHGRVRAQRRSVFEEVEPGTRAYASAGLPGADWWVAGPAGQIPHGDDIDLAEVVAFYADNALWDRVFDDLA